MNIVNVGYDATNYYVLEQNRARLLIDVGWPGTLPKLRATLKRKGLTLADLHGLFVTHYHTTPTMPDSCRNSRTWG